VQQNLIIPAAPKTKAAFVDENSTVTYLPIIAWFQHTYETGETVLKPFLYDSNYPSECFPLEESRCFTRILFEGEELDETEISEHAEAVRAEAQRDKEFMEESRAMRKQIVAALLAAHPAPLSKQEFPERGITVADGSLGPLLRSLRVFGLTEECAGGYCLTPRGVAQAKAAAEKEKAANAT
jgi:hypothetical protein